MTSASIPSARPSLDRLDTCKRKPSSDSNDEDLPAVGMPPFKRRRSETRVDGVPDVGDDDDDDDDDLLYVHIPATYRGRSTRQIDWPVHKSTYWTPGDTTSYHLRYPEMTQLQHEAFVRGASARKEEFRPGKSALWYLAMKYFPPSADDRRHDPAEHPGSPSWTAAPPGTQGCPQQVVASFASAPDSDSPGLVVPITASATSWGRELNQHTRAYSRGTDTRAAKYAFKILLWKKGFDPSKHIRPWSRPTASDSDSDETSFYFYLSTKTTEGIKVNGIELRPDDPQNPSASGFWTKVFDGDVITISPSADHRTSSGKVLFRFRCTWGGSSVRRPGTTAGHSPSPPLLVPGAIARRLDKLCLRAEMRIFEQAVQKRLMAEADADAEERSKNIGRERHRSDIFEARRAAACSALPAKHAKVEGGDAA